MGNLSLPGNPRYQPKDLQSVFGYDNLFRALAEVEIATMKTLADIGIIPKANIASLTPAVEQELLAISTTEVDRVEREVTRHDIRAWVRIAQSKVDLGLRRWIHVPLTSYDALDTARALQFVRGHETVRLLTDRVVRLFAEQVNLFAARPQIGRTHGQHALPITVGFWFATILSRILANIQSANNAAEKLVGKISGAVGVYNAQVGLGIAIAVELAGGVALVLGYRTKLVAAVLALFSIATALAFHSAFGDQNQLIHFFKNIAMAGGLLQIAAFGAGPIAIDSRR